MYKRKFNSSLLIVLAISSTLFLISCQGQKSKQKPVTKEEAARNTIGKLTTNLTFDVTDTAKTEPVSIIIRSIYTGSYAAELRKDLKKYGLENTELTFFNDMTTYYNDAKTVEPIKIEDNKSINTIEVTETYATRDFWAQKEVKPYKHFRYFYGSLIQEYFRNFEINGTADLTLRHPANVEQNFFINLPFATTAKDKNVKYTTNYQHFEFTSSHKGNNIELHYAYHSLKDRIQKNEVPEYIKNAKEIYQILNYKVTEE